MPPVTIGAYHAKVSTPVKSGEDARVKPTAVLLHIVAVWLMPGNGFTTTVAVAIALQLGVLPSLTVTV